MECKADRLNQIRVTFIDLTVFGVPYKGHFTAVRENGDWLPFRYEKNLHRKEYVGDALYASRMDKFLEDPTPAARRRISAMCLQEAARWAKQNEQALIDAELSALRSLVQSAETAAAEAQKALDEANKRVSEAYSELEEFKKAHGIP